MSQNVVSLVVTLAVWRPVVEIQLSFPSIISGFLYTGYTLQFFVSRNPLHLSSKANPGCLLSESMATMIQDTFFIFFLSNQDYDLENFERPNCPKWRDHVSFEQSSQSENPRNAVAGCLQNPWFIVFFESFGNHIINGPTCTPSSRGI